METKKNARVNLEKKRSMFFQIGLLLALGLAFLAFEWQTAPRLSDVPWEPLSVDYFETIEIARTFPEPPPQTQPPPMPSLELEIMDNAVIIDMPVIILDIEHGVNIISSDGFATSAMVEEPEPEIFCVVCVEIPALFDGKPAEESLRDYTGKNLHYPQAAIENEISGRVLVQFVVDQNGNVVDVEVVRSVDPLLDNEAVRLIRSTSGMWTPGMQREKKVKVRYTFPIFFKLQ